MENERILFENSSCLVFNKLCGEDSEKLAGKDLFTVHRLDRPVSGCQLLAKNKKSAAFLSDCFSRRNDSLKIEKLYWAIVEKNQHHNGDAQLPAIGAWVSLEHSISFNQKSNKSYASAYGPPSAAAEKPAGKSGGKQAVLLYKLLGAGDNYLFMEIQPLTGRHHQIRAQLAAEGLRIKGDLKYGARRSEKNGGIRLHARRLIFPDPLNREEKITVTAPLTAPDNLWLAFPNNTNNHF